MTPSAEVGMWLAREAWPTFLAPRRSAQGLQALTAGRLRETFAAAAATPFQAERLRSAGLLGRNGTLRVDDPLAALRRLPALGKAELREAGPAALRGGREDLHHWSSRSSGSTGEPFRVWYDARAWALLKVLIKLRARWLCGLRPHHRLALVDPTPPDRLATSPLERAARLRHVSVLQPAERVAEQLVSFQPHAIYGLPSVLLEAGSYLAGSLRSCALVFASGELLRPGVRRALSSAYGGRVFDVYGTSETKEIAWECRAGNAHVNADVLHVEVLDDAGDPLPPGEEGALVATLLVNSAMPLLRYHTADRGSLRADACSCGVGFPLVGVVSGRETDRLELAGGRWLSPYALTCAVESVPGVLRYQVVQLEDARLRVLAVVAPDARPEAARRIPLVVRAATDAETSVDVEFVDRLEAGADKFRVVVARSATPAAPAAQRRAPEPVS